MRIFAFVIRTLIMVDITLQVSKSAVYTEVAQTTSYIGAKNNDESLYDRIFTTDEDNSMLERFWAESKNTASSCLKRMLTDEKEEDDTYSMNLKMSLSFDEALLQSINRALFSFFVTNIVAKWLAFLNKEEAAAYATAATSHMDNLRRMVYHRKKPERPNNYLNDINDRYGE